jgi:hypothetical protein
LTYASWNGSAWDIQTLDSNYGQASLALDSFNNAHISYIYSTPTSSYVKYKSRTGSNWDNQTVDLSFTSSFELDSNSLTLDSNNNPHICYSEQSDLKTILKYAELKGSNWSIQTIDSEASSSDFYGASISLDSNKYPRIVYGEGNVIYGTVFNNVSNVKYAEWNGQSWSIQTVFLNVSSFGNVALDSNGYPHFTYLVGSSLMYASWDGSTWSTQIVDSNHLVSSYPSGSSFLALDSHDIPHISYWRNPDELNSGTESGLMYAHWTGSTWNIQTVDNNGTSFGTGPIFLDSADNPHISYPSLHYPVDFHYLNIKYASRTESTITQEPFPTLLVVAVIVTVVAVAVIGLLIYVKKRNQKKKLQTR